MGNQVSAEQSGNFSTLLFPIWRYGGLDDPYGQTGIFHWIILALALTAAALLVRIFIFFHDCCHGYFWQA